MKRIFTTLTLSLFLILGAFAQGSITGKVLDGETSEPLIGASVLLKGTTKGTITDFDGNFTIANLDAGDYIMMVSYIGFNDIEMPATVGTTQVDLGEIKASSNAIGLAQVNVIASVAIDRKTPVAVSTIKQSEIEAKLGNQEFPEILKSTPSIYATKSGGGFGDARINVRGFSQENLALMINGIPVNGMEDNKVYWSNWAGLGDVTRTMQVQRGLGASRLSVASVGGTINIITKTTDQTKGGNLYTSIGNDGYNKTGITLSTGRTDNGWAVTFSGSRTTGNGYIEGTYIDAWSYFGSIAKELGTDHQLMFTIFGAPQRHGQRDFEHNIGDQRNVFGKKWNDDFGTYQGRDFLIRDNFYHKPQASLNHIWSISPSTSLITAVYGSTGRGGGTGDIGGFVRAGGSYSEREFRQPKDQYGHQQFDQFALYNTGQKNTLHDSMMTPLTYVIGSDTTSGFVTIPAMDRRNPEAGENGLIKRASMNEHQWYGILSTLNTQLSDDFNLNVGIDMRWYTGSHYRKTIDLFGADMHFDRDNINMMDDWVDMNGDGIKDANEMGNLVRPTNSASRLFGNVGVEDRIDYYNDENINWYGAFGQLEYTSDIGLSAFVSGAVNLSQMRRIDFFNKIESENTTDWSSFIGGNAKIGANYNLDDFNNVFVNAGYIARAPYFDALYTTFNNDEVNEDAANENVLAFELGYGYRSRAFRANLNGYYTSWQNKTEVSNGRDADGNILFLNLLGVDALHKGIELDFSYSPVTAFSLQGFASLNDWQWNNDPSGVLSDENQNVIREDNFFLKGLKVGDAAQTTMGIGATVVIGAGLSIDGQFNYYDNLYAEYAPTDRDDEALVGVQPLLLPNYALLDAGATWKFDLGGFKAQARVNINNVLDTEYVAEAVDNASAEFGDKRDTPEHAALVDGTRGWFGFGRTWNAGLKLFF